MKLFFMPFIMALTAGGVDSEVATTTLSPVIEAMGVIVELLGQVWLVMTANPLLVVFLASSLLVVGIKMFKKVKSAAKG